MGLTEKMLPPSDRRLSEDVVDGALGLNEVSQEFTLFVPTDAAFAKTTTAFAALTQEEIDRVIMFHFYEGMLLTADKLVCGEKIISMNEKGDASRTKCTGVIHTLDAVMFPVSLSELEAESSSDDSSGDMSNVDVSKVKLPTFGGVWNAGSNVINYGTNAINSALNWASF